MFDLFL